MIRKDPYQGFRFIVEIDSLVAGGFSEASGLSVEVQTEDFREGGINHYTHKLLKDIKYPNLVLKKGMTDSDVLWKWCQETFSGKIKRNNIYLTLLDRGGDSVLKWCFENAHPVKWASSEFKADNNATLIESMEFSHQGFKKIL